MSPKQAQFFEKAITAAQAAQAASGVPASITIAQAILESGWGASSLALKANNFFGIKATARALPDQYMEFPTAEYEHGQRVMVEANFARYASPAECFAAHSALLSTVARYAPAMAAKGDPAAFAAQLQACGYSTSPTYAASLMQLVREFSLAQYDAPKVADIPSIHA